MTEKMALNSHPAAHIFPKMDRTDYEELKADIETNGLREPIVLYHGEILDGRNRYRACMETGIEAVFREYTGDDPVAFALSMNLHRRHLNASQRAMIAADLATSKHGGNRSKAQNCALNHARAAEQLGVSERQVDKGSALLKAVASGGTPTELVEQVRSGKIPLNKAEKLVRLPLEQQLEVVAQNDCGTNLRLGQREQRQSWARQFDEMVTKAERMCARMTNLIDRAEKEGELTPERKERLTAVWRNAPRWLSVEIEQPRENSEPAYFLMPILEGWEVSLGV